MSAPTAVRTAPAGTAHIPNRRPRSIDRVVLLACIVLAFVTVGLHVNAYRTLSPIDELQHIDYLFKAPSGHIVARGEHVGQAALREEACRGIDAAFTPPSCTSPAPFDPQQFQERGFDTASVHPPTYYFVTGWAARIANRVLPDADRVTLARAAGALWLAAGLWLIWRMLVARGAAPLAQGALLSLIVVAPAVIHASAVVSPDSTSIFCGAAVLAAVLLWEDRVVPAWVPAAAGVFALAFKFTNISAVGVAVIYLAARAFQQWSARRDGATVDVRRVLRQIGWVTGAALVAWLAWSLVQSAVALVGNDRVPMNDGVRVSSFPPSQLLVQLHAVVSPLRLPYFPPFLRIPRLIGLNEALDLAVLAAAASPAVFTLRGSRERALGGAALATMVTLGPVIVLSTYLATSTITSVPARYGLPILPAVLVAAVPATQRAWLRYVVAIGAAAAVLTMVSQLATA